MQKITLKSLSYTLNRVLGVVLDLKSDMSEVKTDVRPLKQNFAVLQTGMDAVIGVTNTHTTELASVRHALARHETRIERLEARRAQ